MVGGCRFEAHPESRPAVGKGYVGRYMLTATLQVAAVADRRSWSAESQAAHGKEEGHVQPNKQDAMWAYAELTVASTQ